MRIPVIFLLLFILFAGIVVPARAQSSSPGSIMENAPQWARDLRRGEIVAFGSFPFTMFATNFVYGMFRWSDAPMGMNFTTESRQYAPWPFRSAGAIEPSYDIKVRNLCIAAGSSVVIALVDHFIVRHKRNKKEQEKRSMASTPVIVRRPLETDQEPYYELSQDLPLPDDSFSKEKVNPELEMDSPDAP